MTSVELRLKEPVNTGAAYDLFVHMAIEHGYNINCLDITLANQQIRFTIVPLFAPGRLNWENRSGAVNFDIEPTRLTYEHSCVFTPRSLVKTVAKALVQFAGAENVSQTQVTGPLFGGDPYTGLDRQALKLD